jgi:hypothetical protein
MNSAPAERLHRFINAALQPICSAAHSRPEQKNAGVRAGVGETLQKDLLFSKNMLPVPETSGS